MSELPLYRCHKEVRAGKITAITHFDGWTLSLEGCGIVTVSDDWLARHEPVLGGYYVVYADGYKSYSPAEPFESGYTRISA